MKQGETQKYGLFLKNLSMAELEKLLSTILREMRKRDSDHMKGDVVANTKSLWTMRNPG